jgi:hypothetical protein
MSDPILDKLDAEWTTAISSDDYALAAKILRAKVTCLKSSGALSEEKDSLRTWVKELEYKLPDLACEVSLTVIGHLRHARKCLSVTSGDVGSAFRTEISSAERARFRRRNAPPRLGVPNRQDLPKGYAVGSPSLSLQSNGVGNGRSKLDKSSLGTNF